MWLGKSKSRSERCEARSYGVGPLLLRAGNMTLALPYTRHYRIRTHPTGSGNMTTKQIAEAIALNCERYNAGEIGHTDWHAEQHRLWRLADEGNLCIIGSRAERRISEVRRYLYPNGVPVVA